LKTNGSHSEDGDGSVLNWKSPPNISGIALLLLSIGWLLLGASPGTSTGRVCALLFAIGASYQLSAGLSRWRGMFVPFIIVTGSAFYAILKLNVIYGHPTRAPLGYSNAAGAFFVLAEAAALILSVRAAVPTVRAAAALAAVAFWTVPTFNTTVTAAFLGLLIPLGLLARKAARVKLSILGAGAAVSASFLGAVLLGTLYGRGVQHGPLFDLAMRGLTNRRLMLWNDALNLLREHPLRGIGLGRFDNGSPTALRFKDTTWAHNEALQLGAEAGLPGLLVVLASFTWGFFVLWCSPRDRSTAIAALAIGALGIHSNVDYILHFPIIPITAAALVGSSFAARPAHDGVRG
jgi:hypothetical protein